MASCGGGIGFFAGNGDGTLGPSSLIAGTSGVDIFSMVDVNNDNLFDIVGLNNTANYITLIGHGDGTFQTPVTTPLPYSPSNVAAGDINGDGNTDFVFFLGYASAAVTLGFGNGTFGPPTSYPTQSTSLYGSAVSDLNADGCEDVIIYTDGYMGVMHGSRTGALGLPLVYPGPTRATFAGGIDLNHDGRMDILTSSAYHLGEPYDSLVPYLAKGCIQ